MNDVSFKLSLQSSYRYESLLEVSFSQLYLWPAKVLHFIVVYCDYYEKHGGCECKPIDPTTAKANHIDFRVLYRTLVLFESNNSCRFPIQRHRTQSTINMNRSMEDAVITATLLSARTVHHSDMSVDIQHI